MTMPPQGPYGSEPVDPNQGSYGPPDPQPTQPYQAPQPGEYQPYQQGGQFQDAQQQAAQYQAAQQQAAQYQAAQYQQQQAGQYPAGQYQDQLGQAYPPGYGPAPAKKSRKGLWIGGGVIGLAAVGGAAAFGASWFFGTGTQPAEVLPAETIGYLSIDLDPSGAQKVEALKTLQKFPAIKEQLNLDANDDLRPLIFEAIVPESCDLNYDQDVKPWLGERFAISAVDLGGDTPVMAAVAQVSDEGAARKGLDKLSSCGSGGASDVPVAFSGEWMIISETEADAKDVVAAGKKKSLADDATYQKWTEQAGGAGIINAYAAPGAGDLLADNAADLLESSGSGFALASSKPESVTVRPVDDEYDFSEEYDYDDYDDYDSPTEIPAEVTDALRDFEGGAASIRFADGSVEFELAGGMKALAESGQSPANAHETLAKLPEDSAAAIAIGLPDQFLEKSIAEMEKQSDGELTRQDVEDTLAEVGLSIDDVQKALGDRAAIVLGGGFDAEEFADSSGPEDVELGVLVGGSKDDVQEVMDKAKSSIPSEDLAEIEPWMSVGGDSDGAIWAPNQTYLETLQKDGNLGNNATFKSVIDDKNAQYIGYVNLNELVAGLDSVIGDEPEVRENLEPLEAIGVTGSTEGSAMHFKLKLSTD